MPVTPGDIINLVKIAWGGVSGTWRFLHRNKRKLTPAEKLALRDKWKPQFLDFLGKSHRDKLRTDVIIRDMRRIDTYPEISTGKGISSWFRVGLVYTYERGIMVGLSWEALVKEGDGYRYADWKKGEQGDERVLLTGYIPYENIESVDWEGDHYYNYPHIYCYFAFKGEPYEKVVFCKKGDLDGWPYYTEFVKYEAVRKLSKKFGIIR